MTYKLVVFEVNLAKMVTTETKVTFYQISRLQDETSRNWINLQPPSPLNWNDIWKGVFNGSGMVGKTSENI